MSPIPQLDAVVIGGGIAGLWLANLLHQRGDRIVLLEAGQLGCGQTLASQGMIHGGIKYALGGSLTSASAAIAGMPDRWRRCLNGEGDIDLSGLTPLADANLLFADGSGLGRFRTFFASRMLQGRLQRLEPQHWPEALKGCTGWVYALNDLVIDTSALVEQLAAPVADRIYQHPFQAEQATAIGDGWRLQLGDRVVQTRCLVLCAGAGNEQLSHGLGIDQIQMQRRPLRQVIVRSERLKPLYGHCLTGISRSEPRLTITSHPDENGWLWYLGGQLAGDGVNMDDATLIRHARSELTTCLPWVDFHDAQLSILDVDRAEAAADGKRPDGAFAERHNHTIVCWPTKLSLAPDLGDRVLALLPKPSQRDSQDARLKLPPAQSALLRWSR